MVNSGQLSVSIKSLKKMYKRGHANDIGSESARSIRNTLGLLRQKLRLLVQDNTKKGLVDFDFAVVLDES